MSPNMVINLAEQSVYTILLVAGPMLILALSVGLLVSIFQATTQIQEQTLAFVPKIVAVLLSLVFFGPWMLSTLINFTTNLYENISNIIG
ncbi:flagellar biosynthesis protein FliQ [Bacillus horti]|uniref:Flagellar biosynthetic protein FliQ n=1 Tax=Caldalkalibacillus horti TaxID=77523 RepID=A0ABT9VUL2_9BACI|nr:flagellar biosynthesis protein FliQ [Bacillus horti]MDQ0164677.1 flagellar biosynthetic protein FliQ [Bacillus horti]